MSPTVRRTSMAVMFVVVALFSTACTVDDVLNIVKLLQLFGIL